MSVESGGVRIVAEKVEMWAVEDLVPYARNAKRHPPEQIKQLVAGMREFGFTIPVLAAEARLSESQRGMVAAKIANLRDGQRADRSANLRSSGEDMPHLTAEQQAAIDKVQWRLGEELISRDEANAEIAKIDPHWADRDRAAPIAPVTQAEAARLLNVGERSVQSARRVLDKGVPELVQKV